MRSFLYLFEIERTRLLDLKPGSMTKPLTLGVLILVPNICSQRGQLTPQNQH